MPIAAAERSAARPGRLVLAGLVAGLALNGVMLLTFRLIGFGWDGGGILLDPARQSPKLIAVWTALEPLPRVVTEPAPIIAGLMLFGLLHAWLYSALAPRWNGGTPGRAVRFAVLLFALVYLFWEFFTPFNLFREPLPLVALELLFWFLIALAEAFVIALVLDRQNPLIILAVAENPRP